MMELKTTLRKSHNTTPVPDKIPYEFLKQLLKNFTPIFTPNLQQHLAQWEHP